MNKCNSCKKYACMMTSAGIYYCKEHFIQYFQKKVFSTIRRYKMIRKGQKIAIALSGGKDSIVLLHILNNLSKSLPIKLYAILIDEGITGYRDKTIRVAKSECKRLGIKLKILTFENNFSKTLDVIKKRDKTTGACTYCGVFRRTLLNRGAVEIGADLLATGHNLDDAVQTIFLNQIRNEPMRLLRFGPNAKRIEHENMIQRIMPLVACTEIEVALWAALNNIYIDHLQCPYAEEAMRQHIRKIVNETEDKYPGSKVRIFKSFLTMQSKCAGKTEDKIKICRICSEASAGDICATCRLIKQIN